MSSAITVGELLERAELEVTAVAGHAGISRIVTVPRIQKPGLALTGWPEQLHPHRVLVLGGTEIEYLVRESCPWPARETDYDGATMSAPPSPADHDDWAY